ncbi:hypothetical protein [Robertmurraya sp. P23]
MKRRFVLFVVAALVIVANLSPIVAKGQEKDVVATQLPSEY